LGSIDGIQLSHFELGALYEVGTSLGSYLLALGAAEPVNEDVPARVLPISQGRPEKSSTTETSRSIAADRPRRRK
jgi:hypothetical protein